MNAEALIRRMESFPDALQAAVAEVTSDEARRKPVSGAWSILEIVCHLVDEERDDFRTRLELTLRDPGAEWPAIDPEGWAVERRYLERDLTAMLTYFQSERKATVAWLRSLDKVDWTIAHIHPKFGPIAAGDLIAAWAAHDALHLRQIAKRLYELAGGDAPEFSTRYAGDWGP